MDFTLSKEQQDIIKAARGMEKIIIARSILG
jgi:hypothetical protein